MTYRRLATAVLALRAAASPALAGTDLGGGVNTLTDVSDRSLISRDVSDMYDLCDKGDYNGALNIYEAGKNSPKYDARGNALPQKRTLMAMSTDAADGKFEGEPTFMYHVYGLSGGACEPDEVSQHYTYADAFVRDALREERGTIGAEGALALNLWYYSVHELYDGIEDCARSESGANVQAAAAGLNDNGNGAYAMDEFIAFWIGDDNAAGTLEGHSLYALTQRAGDAFGTVDSGNGEARANTRIKDLYNEAMQLLSGSDACLGGSDTVKRLWGITHRLISEMTVPLVQVLVGAMKEGDADRVRLYARAVVPQTSRCRPSTHRRLKESLLDRTYNPSKFLTILADLQSTYDCLGITCEDVGAYKETEVPTCAAFPVGYPLAQYTPTTDVHEHAKIDLDISELKVLLCFDSDRSYDMASLLYQHGRNSRKPDLGPDGSVEYRSLRDMARSSLRERAPWYASFLEYHRDNFYADKVITETLAGRGKWGSASRGQRSEVIAKTAQYQVVFMYLLAEMADANADCEAGDKTDNEGSVHSWDEVVAYYVGSMEGTGEGGSDDFEDGQLMWNLGNRRCTQFGTENSAGWSQVMAAVEDDFYAGVGELDAYDCVNLQKTVKKIRHLSLVPIIQSVIRYAIKNEKHVWNSGSKDLAEGEAFALAILPVLGAYDPVGRSIVEENMIMEEGKEPVQDGAQAVADAFYPLMMRFGLECQYVGASDGVDACSATRSGAMAERGGIAASIVAIVCSAVAVAALWMA